MLQNSAGHRSNCIDAAEEVTDDLHQGVAPGRPPSYISSGRYTAPASYSSVPSVQHTAWDTVNDDLPQSRPEHSVEDSATRPSHQNKKGGESEKIPRQLSDSTGCSHRGDANAVNRQSPWVDTNASAERHDQLRNSSHHASTQSPSNDTSIGDYHQYGSSSIGIPMGHDGANGKWKDTERYSLTLRTDGESVQKPGQCIVSNRYSQQDNANAVNIQTPWVDTRTSTERYDQLKTSSQQYHRDASARKYTNIGDYQCASSSTGINTGRDDTNGTWKDTERYSLTTTTPCSDTSVNSIHKQPFEQQWSSGSCEFKGDPTPSYPTLSESSSSLPSSASSFANSASTNSAASGSQRINKRSRPPYPVSEARVGEENRERQLFFDNIPDAYSSYHPDRGTHVDMVLPPKAQGHRTDGTFKGECSVNVWKRSKEPCRKVDVARNLDVCQPIQPTPSLDRSSQLNTGNGVRFTVSSSHDAAEHQSTPVPYQQAVTIANTLNASDTNNYSSASHASKRRKVAQPAFYDGHDNFFHERLARKAYEKDTSLNSSPKSFSRLVATGNNTVLDLNDNQRLPPSERADKNIQNRQAATQISTGKIYTLPRTGSSRGQSGKRIHSSFRGIRSYFPLRAYSKPNAENGQCLLPLSQKHYSRPSKSATVSPVDIHSYHLKASLQHVKDRLCSNISNDDRRNSASAKGAGLRGAYLPSHKGKGGFSDPQHTCANERSRDMQEVTPKRTTVNLVKQRTESTNVPSFTEMIPEEVFRRLQGSIPTTFGNAKRFSSLNQRILHPRRIQPPIEPYDDFLVKSTDGPVPPVHDRNGLIPLVTLPETVEPNNVIVGNCLFQYPIAIWRKFLDHPSIKFPSRILDVERFVRKHYKVDADVQYQHVDSEGWNTDRPSVARQRLGMYLSHLRRCCNGEGPVLPVLDDISAHTEGSAAEVLAFVGNPFYCPGNAADEQDAKKCLAAMRKYKCRFRYTLRELFDQICERKISPESAFSAPYVTPEMAAYWELEELPKPPVRYCVNVDLDNEDEWSAELDTMRRHLPKWIWCRDELDVMSEIRQPVPGMNCPQIYMKSSGAWTGCHEENLRFHSVNICHGPDPSEWCAISKEHAPRLRTLFWEEYGMDIYRNEGCYLPPVEFCESNGIPVMKGVQRAGDLVCLKGDTLHWVRSYGISVHSSWNMGPWEESTLVAAALRRSINDSLNPPLPSLIPLKTLCLDISRVITKTFEGGSPTTSHRQHHHHSAVQRLIDHDPMTLRNLIARLLFELVIAIQKEICISSAGERTLKRCEFEPPGSNVLRCQNSKCNTEIFVHYVYCGTCFAAIEAGKDDKPTDTKQTERKSYIAPAPGRTDGPIEIHSQFCVPSLALLTSENRRQEEEVPQEEEQPIDDDATVERKMRSRLHKKKCRLNRHSLNVVSPLMCVPCGLSHFSKVGGEHSLCMLKKENVESVVHTYSKLAALWRRFAS